MATTSALNLATSFDGMCRLGVTQEKSMTVNTDRTVTFDESGGDGENLVAATHQVYAQGSVCLEEGEAAAFIADLRHAAAYGAAELKSSTALKRVDPEDLIEILGRHRMNDDRANIYIIEKSFYLTGKIISLILEEDAYAKGVTMPVGLEQKLADELASNAEANVGADNWNNLLAAFNFLIKRQPARGGKPKAGAAEAFFTELEKTRNAATGSVRTILDIAWDGREHVRGYETASDSILRELDPTVSAFASGIATWSLRLNGKAFEAVHDEHWSLNQDALGLIRRSMPAIFWAPGAGPTVVTTGESSSDARLQAADIIAGIGRHVSQRALAGQTPDQLTTAILPMLDFNSMHATASPLQALFDSASYPYLTRAGLA